MELSIKFTQEELQLIKEALRIASTHTDQEFKSYKFHEFSYKIELIQGLNPPVK